MLAPGLKTPTDVVHKMERELRRAFHHKNYVHKADHLFNFCVTAHSMRDMVFLHFGVSEKTEKDRMHATWSSDPKLRAAADIANSSKHFDLRTPPKTKGVERTRSEVINVLVSDEGDVKTIPEEAPDLEIQLEDGSAIGVYDFTSGVIEYWRDFLEDRGHACPVQDEATYFGDEEDADPSPSIFL